MQTAGFDHIIKKNFEGDIQFKRVKKEIQLLKELNQEEYKISLQNSVIGLKIVIEMSKKLLKEKIPEISESVPAVLFEILLENKYPFIFPKVTCRNSFSRPSLADGRDFLADIVRKIWCPSILLNEIVVLIPNFLKEVFMKINDKFALQSYGAYHLGHTYNLEDFLAMDTLTCFSGTELLSNNKAPSRYVMLTDCSLLNFEILDSKKSLLKLVSWANLQSLINITRRKEEENTLILTWKDSQKKDGVIQILNIENSVKFLSELIKNMKTFGVKVNKNIIKQPDLTIDDVTIKAYEQINIEKFLENAKRLEKIIETNTEISLIKELMTCYQNIIEYFSAINDQRFQEFLKKMHDFLNREEISRVLKEKDQKEQIKKNEEIQEGEAPNEEAKQE